MLRFPCRFISLIAAATLVLVAGPVRAAFRDLPGDRAPIGQAQAAAPTAASAARSGSSAAASMAATTGFPFSRSVGYATGSQPRTVTAADLNGDGHPELIVPSNGGNTTMVLFGAADGLYDSTPRATLFGTNNGQKAVVGDFNADGLPDIAVVHFFGGIFVWLQNPDGSFGSGGFANFVLSINGNFHSGLAAGDLNGDGNPDLVATSATGFVSVWYAPGAFGIWMNGGDYPTFAQNADWVELADLNGDGRLDAAVTDDAPYDRVSILLGTGAGGSSAFGSTSTYSVGSGPNTCTVSDVNADGRPDLLVASWNVAPFHGSLTVLTNQGFGSFSVAVTHPFGLQEDEPFSVAAGDVTGDGRVDAVVANGTFGTVSVLTGNGNGTFGAKRSVGVGSAARGIALADVNGDGRPDVATSNLNANTVQVLLNGPSGTFSGPIFRAGNDTPDSYNVDDRLVASLASADFNGDGHRDLVTVHRAAGTVSVMLGAGNGTYGAPVDIPAGNYPQAVAAADFDHDGMMDLAVACAGNGTVSVLLGKGDGTFKGKTSYGAGAGTADVVVADVNADGRPDLVTANAADNTISVLLKNNGGGGFKDRINVPAGTDPRSVALGDLNGDGRLDAVVADSSGGGFSVLFGSGDGHFTYQFSANGGFGATSAALGDLDRDGALDLALSDTGNNLLRIFRGNGAGNFFFGTITVPMSEPRRVGIADLDGNGWLEVIVGARLGQTYLIYPFEPVPPRGFLRAWAVGAEGGAVLALDANEDGATDLVTMNARNQSVNVLVNETGSGPSLAAGRPLAGTASGAAITGASVVPNPMNPSATMRFTLSAPGPLRVRLFDARGRLVRTLVDEPMAAAGARTVLMSGADGRGRPLSTGVYYYRIETDRGTATGRVTLLK
jgi:hypothetical protein